MRISDWSSDVCSSDLAQVPAQARAAAPGFQVGEVDAVVGDLVPVKAVGQLIAARLDDVGAEQPRGAVHVAPVQVEQGLERVAFVQELHARGGFVIALEAVIRSEEHTSELQSLMRISYAVFCL